MSDLLRNILVAVLVVLMAVFAFFSGYLANDYVEERTRRTVLEEEQFTVFWEAWDRIEENFLGELPDARKVTYAAIRGSLQTLNDPYTVFLEPVVRQEERENLRGNFGGIGASLTRTETGEIVLETTPGNPAEAAGIQAGDVLLAIDGQTLDPEMPVNAIAELIKGEVGTTVVLTIAPVDGSEVRDFEIERAEILIPSVIARLLREDATIGYVQLIRFTEQSGSEISDAVTTLAEQGAQRFVLDLRNNGGGLLNAAVDVSDAFLANKVVYHQVTRGEGESSAETNGRLAIPEDVPLVLLINGGTASSAEIVAGALRDHERATLIGEKTYGKGSVQLVYDLSDTSSVHVTWARWLTPNRNTIDQNGLFPDIGATSTQEGLDNGRDEQLERAVKFLQTGE